MITFLDENDVEYGALSTIKATNAVNGERSLTGTIVSGDYVLSNIERGWRLRFDNEYYVVTYAKPIDEGRDVQVEFDAVHQFFWDFDKSSVYDQLADGSHTFVAYLDFIFKNSGYSYTVDSALNVYAFEKQSFGLKKRLTLFNDIITSTDVEFQINGKVVRILEKVGTDLSTVVRKNFNMNELTIEKNIGDFVTYQKGYGAYFDEEDHSKGRLEVEYTSPLASVYGRLEAEPFVDERYSQSGSLLAVLKKNVDNSYTISVSLDMEDLTRAGYKYKQPIAGDYIMAINETLDFQEKIRIVSFTSEYDVQGILVKHEVTCNDIGTVKKLSASYNLTKKQAASASDTASNAYSIANKALVSADGKNTNYYSDSFPVDNPKGTLKTGDLLFLTVGDTVKQYYWNGADWVINPVIDDVEAFKEQISEELKDVPNREEFENKIAEEVANSKAEIEIKIETAKTQAESNAKEYADTINEETAKVAELANAAAGEIKADLVNVKNNLTETSLVANNAQAAVDAAKQELTEVANELSTAKQDLTNSVAEVNTKVNSTKEELTQAKQDLMSHAQQLQTQANAQTELTKRVTTVETTANGTKTTVSELSKTVAQNGKDITSVTARTKVVEDDLSGTKTTLSQVKTTADSASQKTATLETGLNGLSAKFDSLKIGGRNLLAKTNQGKTNWAWSISSGGATAENYDVDGVNAVKLTRTSDASVTWHYIAYWGLIRKLIEPDTKYTLSFDVKPSVDVTFSASLKRGDGLAPLTNSVTMNKATANQWTKVSCVLTSTATLSSDLSQVVYLSGMPTANGNWLVIKNIKLEKGNIATDYSPNETDLEQKVAEYKQNADQNYASLSSTVQNLDGTVQQNKSEFDQTASQLKTSISAVESKIPTTVGGRNYIRNYGLTATGWISLKPAWKFEIISDSTAKSGQYLKATCTTASTGMGGFYKDLFDFSDGRFFGKQMTWSMDIKTSKNAKLNIGCEWGNAQVNVNATENWQRFSKTFKVATSSNQKAWIFYSSNWEVGDIVYVRDVQLEDGSIATSPVPAPEDYDSKLATAQSEIKQTTDAIKASVSSLDSSTVKSSSLTINADGIVMKAGKSTTDVANAIGSYFAVNQNAINLFSDKINVKGNMIVSGAITSDKIASQQINTAHLNGKIITADVISSNAVTADAIKAGAVTTDKMSANSINGDRITAGTLDAAKIKAGSITASQIASGTITSNQIKAGGISAANIATGAITTDKIAAGAIDANKIAANAITANMITGGQLRSTNGATVFDLNAGTLTFNNNYGYIQRVASDKIFEITTYLGKSLIDSRDYLTSAFKVRKSDNSRRSGIQFSLYNMVDNQPTATTEINSDSLNLYDSQNTKLFSVNGRSTWLGNFNMQGWGDIPVAQVYGGLIVKDIGIGGRSKSLLKIVEELCNKAGIWWM